MGFKAIESKFTGFIKAEYIRPVGRTRHYIGIVLLCANVVTTFILALYAWYSFAGATPEGTHPIVWGLDMAQQASLLDWVFLIEEISFLIAIYVLGSDFHHPDPTKYAVRAVTDAIYHCTMLGLGECQLLCDCIPEVWKFITR